MKFIEGFQANGSNSITGIERIITVGAGLIEEPYNLHLDIALLEFQLISIMKQELKKVTRDLDKLNKMLQGSYEDREIAFVLLEKESKYIVPILKVFNIGTI